MTRSKGKAVMSTTMRSEIPPPSPLPSTSTSTPLFFEKLPPEVRNIIYEMAYTDETPLRVKAKRNTRSSRRDVAPEDTSAQRCILNRLMVSNQWFTEVVTIFASRTIFGFCSVEDMFTIVTRLPTYLRLNITMIDLKRRSYLRSDCSSISKSGMEGFASALPSLHRLRVFRGIGLGNVQYLSTPQMFEDHANHTPWVRLLRMLREVEDFQCKDEEAGAQMCTEWEKWMRAEVSKPKGT